VVAQAESNLIGQSSQVQTAADYAKLSLCVNTGRTMGQFDQCDDGDGDVAISYRVGDGGKHLPCVPPLPLGRDQHTGIEDQYHEGGSSGSRWLSIAGSISLDAGADINARSRWWTGGLGLLDSADPGLAAHAIMRGAVVSVHAAARLAMLDKLKELMAGDPQLVRARGGDGQTPLHFASTIEIAQYLVDHGAEIDARDVDHESTPAQYMLRKRPAIARYLVRRGCHTNILMAASLGDVPFAGKQSDPDCIRMRVSDEYFPLIGPRNGGTSAVAVHLMRPRCVLFLSRQRCAPTQRMRTEV
jgi:hypothetical protein